MSLPAIEYLVEIVAYDPSGPGTVTLRYSTIGKTTGPAETPANTFYDARLQEPGVIRRAIAEGRELFGAARISVGEVVLQNLDGALDALATYGFDGRTLTLRQGVPGAAYPSGYTTVYVGTMDDVEVTRKQVRIRLRDNTLGLDTPLQTTTYDGDNALPDGLEGVAGDLKGKVKPLLYGVAKNLPVPCVNTAKLIYQVSDSAVESVDGVYDRGIALLERRDAWDLQTSPFGDSGGEQILGLAYSSETDFGGPWLVAVGTDGTDGIIGWAATNTATLTTDTPSAFAGESVLCVASGVRTSPGEYFFLMGGENGVLIGVGDGDFTTPDTITSQFSTDAIRAAYYWPERHLWVLVGDAGKISTSADGGQTFTARTSGVATALYGITAIGDVLVACGASGVIRYSEDGITWTAAESDLGSVTLRVACRGRGYATIAGDSNTIGYAENGRFWRSVGGAHGSTQVYRAAFYARDRMLVVGDGEAVAESRTGESFTPLSPNAATQSNFLSISAYGEATTYIGGYNTTGGGTGAGSELLAPTAIGEYASQADLLDDELSPAPGTAKPYFHTSGSYIRLGSPPAGLITVDATQGAAASNRTAGQLFVAVLTKAGYTAGDWSASDITALDTADNSECGLWIDSAMTTFEALDMIAASVGAWWGTDKAGVFRVKQWTTPSGTAALAFTDNDLLTLERLPSDRPVYRTTLQYARNYVVQDRDVAFGVTDARRAQLAKEWREAVNESASVQTMHLLADATVEPTLYATEADALAEAARRQTLRGTKRTRLIATVALDADTEALDLGDVVTVTSDRFGLSAGVDFRITALEPQRATRRLRLSLWA